MKKIIFIMSISAILLANIIIFNIYNKNQIIYSEAKYIADFNDDRKVSGFADNVFVGKVIENVGTIEENGEGPNTSFKVHILYNIKGDVNGDIDIIQEGGYFKNGNLLVVEGNKLLEIGNTYLFTSRKNGLGKYRLWFSKKIKNSLSRVFYFGLFFSFSYNTMHILNSKALWKNNKF